MASAGPRFKKASRRAPGWNLPPLRGLCRECTQVSVQNRDANPRYSPQPSEYYEEMPTFGEVFSTTWKVLLALFLISLGMGLMYLILAVIGSRSTSSTSSTRDADDWSNEYRQRSADDAPTKMPKSQWDEEMKRCAREGTVIEGMSKEEVGRAVGGKEPWTFSIVTLKSTDQKCIRYAGERCVQYPPDEVKTFVLRFTPKGHLIWDGDSIGLSVYGRYLPDVIAKRKAETLARGKAEAVAEAKAEAQARADAEATVLSTCQKLKKLCDEQNDQNRTAWKVQCR